MGEGSAAFPSQLHKFNATLSLKEDRIHSKTPETKRKKGKNLRRSSLWKDSHESLQSLGITDYRDRNLMLFTKQAVLF